MEDNSNETEYRNGIILPFQEIEEQFEDWVNWLGSVKQSYAGQPVIRTPLTMVHRLKATADQDINSGFPWDIGGEGGEAV